jgi:hypothetical protein
MPALRRGPHFKLLLNIPPEEEPDVPIFPYASSGQAFQRLSAALAAETKDMGISVLIGDPEVRRLAQVVPDPDAGPRAATFRLPAQQQGGTLVSQIASLLGPGDWGERKAG